MPETMTRAGHGAFADPRAARRYRAALAILLLLAVCSPVLGVAVYSVVQGAPVWGWVALVAGVVWCGLLLWGGVVFGGRVLDRRGPRVLATIRTWPGHSQPV